MAWVIVSLAKEKSFPIGIPVASIYRIPYL
jgi:hypothetical protein